MTRNERIVAVFKCTKEEQVTTQKYTNHTGSDTRYNLRARCKPWTGSYYHKQLGLLKFSIVYVKDRKKNSWNTEIYISLTKSQSFQKKVEFTTSSPP